MNKTVFISYSWREPSAGIVNNWLKTSLRYATIKVSVDKDDCQYHDSIDEVEQKIGDAEMIIAVVSKPFLESIHCMYEMASVFEKGGEMSSRLFVIGIEEVQSEDEIRNIWREKYKTTEEALNAEDFAREPLEKKFEQLSLIRKHLGKFLVYLSDRNRMNFTEVSKDNFNEIVKILFNNNRKNLTIPEGDLLASAIED